MVGDKSRAERQIHTNTAIIENTEDEAAVLTADGDGPIIRGGDARVHHRPNIVDT